MKEIQSMCFRLPLEMDNLKAFQNICSASSTIYLCLKWQKHLNFRCKQGQKYPFSSHWPTKVIILQRFPAYYLHRIWCSMTEKQSLRLHSITSCAKSWIIWQHKRATTQIWASPDRESVPSEACEVTCLWALFWQHEDWCLFFNTNFKLVSLQYIWHALWGKKCEAFQRFIEHMMRVQVDMCSQRKLLLLRWSQLRVMQVWTRY